MRVRYVALHAAADLDPFRALAREPKPNAIVDFEIIGEHQRTGAVDNIGEADRVAEHLLRRTFEAEVIGVDDGAIDRDRMHHAKLLKLTHERQVRIDIAVPAPYFEYAPGFILALAPFQRRDVVAK